MADQEQVHRLRTGVQIWNEWRRVHSSKTVDLSGADLNEADLIKVDLDGANIAGANLSYANLIGADLGGADLSQADLSWADLSRSHLDGANLSGAILRETRLSGANLSGVNLSWADLDGADLSWTNLSEANLTHANLKGCSIFGVSAWKVQLEGTAQTNLRITPEDEPEITVDNLEVAQFLYLMLHNEKIRDLLETITSKVVLILGRFSDERKPVLDALRVALRERPNQYVPVLFDFDPVAGRHILETVSLLARLARFVIADTTDPKMVWAELALIAPHLPSVPIQPLLLASADPMTDFGFFRKFPWVLPIYRYHDISQLLAALDEVISPAEQHIQTSQRHG